MGNQAGIIIRNVKNELFHSAKRLILNEVKGIECLQIISNYDRSWMNKQFLTFKFYIMADLINYCSFSEKGKQYHTNIIIDDEQTLDDTITNLLSNEHLIYRGLNDASYRMYTSSQRHFIWQDQLYQNVGGAYHEFVRKTINRVMSDASIMSYFQKNNIPLNDFLVLALLQHYIECSPLLDFAYDLRSSMFFAMDKVVPPSGKGGMGDYISIYFTDNRIDWIQATIEAVNRTGANSADTMVKDANEKGMSVDANNTAYDMQHLTYENYINNISFIPVSGACFGVTDVVMNHLGVSWQYNITNPRLQQQKGLFIFNTSQDIPLAERVNSVTKYYKNFGCININKNLIPYIKAKYLDPLNINNSTIYFKTQESADLQAMVKNLFRI